MADSLRIAVHHNLAEGGALRALRQFVSALEARHYVTWALLDGRGKRVGIHSDAKFLSLPGDGTLHYLHKVADLWNLREADRAARRLAQAIDAGGFDIVFLHPCRFGQAPSLLRYVRTPSIYYCNEPLRLYREAIPFEDGASRALAFRAGRAIFAPVGRMLNRRDRFLARRASLLLTNSTFSARAVEDAYRREAVVVSPGVDTDSFHPGGKTDRPPYLLSVGKLVERKGHYLAVRFVAALPPARRLPLVVAGFPAGRPFRKRLAALAADRGVDLRIRTNVDDGELADLYRNARLTFSLSRGEPLGLAALESQACGTPVVALDEGGHRETVAAGVTGVLVDADPARSAGEIGALLGDRSRLFAMGKAGRRMMEEKWSVAAAGSRLLAEVERFVDEN